MKTTLDRQTGAWTRGTRHGALALMLALAGVLAACGGGDADATSPADGSSGDAERRIQRAIAEQLARERQLQRVGSTFEVGSVAFVTKEKSEEITGFRIEFLAGLTGSNFKVRDDCARPVAVSPMAAQLNHGRAYGPLHAITASKPVDAWLLQDLQVSRSTVPGHQGRARDGSGECQDDALFRRPPGAAAHAGAVKPCPASVMMSA